MSTKNAKRQKERVGISAHSKEKALVQVRVVLDRARHCIQGLPYSDDAKKVDFQCSGSTVVLKALFWRGATDWLALPAQEQASSLLRLPAWMLYLLIHLPALLTDLTRARTALEQERYRSSCAEKAQYKSLKTRLDAALNNVTIFAKRAREAEAKVEEVRATCRIVYGEMMQVIRSEERERSKRMYWPGTAYAEVQV